MPPINTLKKPTFPDIVYKINQYKHMCVRRGGRERPTMRTRSCSKCIFTLKSNYKSTRATTELIVHEESAQNEIKSAFFRKTHL